ncbi:nuclease-related domain-containing protein [Aliiglaciecola sp. CAU 1673]|uniref:nuclease-related domain-containing protein n=1 Tax=Aliiglaciecola sp. CAU 1673 TaxID=3032595 RepID=UPI0023DC377C|nr:nuclease-related domain-containing protein [Aliiglaciecola sp. CAU 1673]MDF2180139.1 nuclease-related domain-containing protein [Aliiglaciecola sp. CAU 1673]
MFELGSSVIALAILLSGMGATLVPMFFLLKRREQTVKLPIDREQLLRLPGYGLQKEIIDKQFELLGSMLIGMCLVISPFAYYSIHAFVSLGSIPYLPVFLVVVGIVYGIWKTIKNFNHLTRLRLGHTAELATAGELIQLQAFGYQVFHDIQAEKFNIDHLAIGPNGVFAIETKGRHKRHADSSNGKDRANGIKSHELIFKDGKLHFPSWQEIEPIQQAERQAKWVTQWLTKACGFEISAVPVLVFPGWFVKLQSRVPFPILNHKMIVSTLPKNGNSQFTQEQINVISWQVAQRSIQGKRD